MRNEGYAMIIGVAAFLLIEAYLARAKKITPLKRMLFRCLSSGTMIWISYTAVENNVMRFFVLNIAVLYLVLSVVDYLLIKRKGRKKYATSHTKGTEGR